MRNFKTFVENDAGLSSAQIHRRDDRIDDRNNRRNDRVAAARNDRHKYQDKFKMDQDNLKKDRIELNLITWFTKLSNSVNDKSMINSLLAKYTKEGLDSVDWLVAADWLEERGATTQGQAIRKYANSLK